MQDGPFEDLLRASRPAMLLSAIRLVGPDRADEVVQQASLNAWTRRQSCRATSNPHLWLQAFVKNAARKICQNRGWKQSTMRDQDQYLLSIPDTRTTAEQALVDAQQAQDLLSVLDPMERRLVQLVAIQGLTQWQAVRRLRLWPDMEESTRKVKVGRVYKRALKKMRLKAQSAQLA